MPRLSFNPILMTDSYKLCHAFSYADEAPGKIIGMHSYIEARTNGRDIIIPFGLQMFIEKFLTTPITADHIDEAEDFALRHGEPFNRRGWEIIVNDFGGFLPVTIRAVPEGTPVPSGNVIVTIECDHVDYPDLFWLSSYLETALQRGVWYPTTIATNDYYIKNKIRTFYEATGADLQMLPFALHDFGSRGVSSGETAEIGGAAHLVNFMGTDNIEGVRAAQFYYGTQSKMPGYSVPATEHSVQCSFSLDDDRGGGDLTYMRHQIKRFGKPGGIISMVIDGYDVYRACEMLCTELKQDIIDSGAKVVFRPDSGEMMEVVPRILKMQELALGYDLTEKGYKKIRHVGIIQGDGVDNKAIVELLTQITGMGYSADCVIFGSGGSLLQKVNRDTYKFAQKASAVNVEGRGWVGIAKNPVTDPGKVSKKGRLTLLRSKTTGEFFTADISSIQIDKGWSDEWEDVMRVVYSNGTVFNRASLDEVRERCAV